MTHLPDPIRRMLDDAIEEERVRAIWDETRASMARRSPAARSSRAQLVIPALAVAIALLAIVPFTDDDPAPAAPSFFTLRDGSAPVAVTALARRTLTFADGSSITLAPGGRIAPTANDGARFELALAHGVARFDIEPGGPRRWRIDCGAITVEVIGTVFTIHRSAQRIRVAVARGTVAVRGERVPTGERWLRAGESIEVVLDVAAPPPSPSIAPIEPAPAPIAARGREERWRRLARTGDHDAAYDALGGDGIARRTAGASANELMLLADVARLSGHPADAVDPLERLLDEHAGDPQAPLAAIILARIEQQRGDHAGAARALDRALALGVPAALDEETRASLVIARSRAGDRAGADTAARAYLARHPEGPRAAAVRAWIIEP